MKQSLRLPTIMAVLLLMVLAAQCLVAAWTAGQTTDETFYNGSGYPIVRYNNYEFLGEHPPLMIQLGALPLLLIQPNFPIQERIYVPGTDRLDLSRYGARFLYEMGNDPKQILFLERLPMIVLTILLGFAIFSFAREIYGGWGALLALALYVFTPDIIANGSFYMTDMGLTAFYFFAIYALKKFFDDPSLRNSIVLGIFCGLTFVTKISGLILFPIITLLFLLFFLMDPKARSLAPIPGSFDRRFGALAIFLLINTIAQKQAMVTFGPLCMLAVYLCFKDTAFFSRTQWMRYGLKALFIAGYFISFFFSVKLQRKYGIEASTVFILWNVAAAIFAFCLLRFWQKDQVLRLTKLFLAVWLVSALVIILDYTDFFYKFYRFIGFGNYIKPFGIVLSHSLAGHRGCFDGSFVTCDWRFQFCMMAIRTPALVLGLSLLGFFLLLRSKIPALVKSIIIVPIVIFFGVAVFNKIYIGTRHILPTLPFLFILGGFPGAVVANMRNNWFKTTLVFGLSIMLILTASRTFLTAPDYFVYFNEFVGGIERGARHVSVNWGQDNERLAKFVLKKQIPLIKIATGMSNADIYNYYKINWKEMSANDPIDPAPGFYALDVGMFVHFQKDPRSWFRGKRPDFRVGKTFYIFEVRHKTT